MPGISLRKIKRALHPKSLQRMMLRFTMQRNNVECPCCGATFVTFYLQEFKNVQMRLV